MMTPLELERWQTKQVTALTDSGVNPLDAYNQVTRFLAKLPVGADPNTYVPRDMPYEDLMRDAVLNDLRSWWYGNEDVPARFKRLLDARGK